MRILDNVTGEASRTLAVIRECLATDRYAVSNHFSQRLAQRSLFWPDVEAVIEEPIEVVSQGMDHYNRPKWLISGEATTGDEIEIVCAVEVDDSETEFITLYWQD